MKVIQNAKYNHDRKQRPANSNSNNMADDVQTILNSLNENPFIRSVIANNEKKPPNIVCYTDELAKLHDKR